MTRMLEEQGEEGLGRAEKKVRKDKQANQVGRPGGVGKSVLEKSLGGASQ